MWTTEFDISQVDDPAIPWPLSLIVVMMGVAIVLIWSFQPQQKKWGSGLVAALVMLVMCLAIEVAGVVSYISEWKQHSSNREWRADNRVNVVEGVVEEVVAKDKLWKSDPVPSFRVAEATFEFGLYSNNPHISREQLSRLADSKARVRVYFKPDQIMCLESQDGLK